MTSRAKPMPNTAPAAQRSEKTEQQAQQAASPAQVSRATRGGVRVPPSAYVTVDILAMQRTVGNQAVGRLLAQTAQPQPIQKEASTDWETGMNHDRRSSQPLEAGVQRSMQQATGADFSGVQAHTDAQSDYHCNVSGIVQRYPTQDDKGRLDAMIYVISENDLTKAIYVGQTTDTRAGARFIEHVKNDKWAPWWIGKGIVYGNDESKWPYRVRTLEALKDVTKFETTVAEQWWLEDQLKKGNKLLNDSTPCSLDNFNKRSIHKSLYDPKRIQVSATWKPSMKAK